MPPQVQVGDRARRRRSARPTTSPRTWASSRSRCSCSPACRCSWARSRSSTRSRSRSRSARASSGCSGRSAPRGTRSSASVGPGGAHPRAARRRWRASPAGSASRSAINELFKAAGIDLPNTGTVSATRTVVVSLIVGRARDAGGRARAGAAGHAHHADGRAPRGRARGHEDARPRRDRRRPSLLGAIGLAMMLIGLFGGIEDSGSAAGLLGGGAALILFGVSLFSPRLVRPLASVDGPPARAPARHHRPARARERDAQAGPHRHHRGRADDRPRARRLRDRLRRGPQELGREDDRRELPRRDRAPEQRQLLADPARRGRDGARRGRRADGLLDHLRHGRAPERGRATCASRRSTPRRSGRCWRSTFKSGDPSVLAGLGAERTRSWTTPSPATRGSASGDTLRLRTPLERTASFTVRGTVEGELDLLGKAIVDESATRAVRAAPAELRARAARAGRLAEGRAAGDRRRAEGPLSDRRGPEPEPAEGPAGGAGQPAARAWSTRCSRWRSSCRCSGS